MNSNVLSPIVIQTFTRTFNANVATIIQEFHDEKDDSQECSLLDLYFKDDCGLYWTDGELAIQ